MITNKDKDMEELTLKRHAGFISAISRVDLTEKIMSNDRICSIGTFGNAGIATGRE